mgnify:CR=1 FL=1
MKRFLAYLLIMLFNMMSFSGQAMAGTPGLPKEVRGFCVGVPSYDRLDDFIQFVQSELVPRKVNVLLLRVDYRYQYRSHPELVAPAKRKTDTLQSVALSEAEMKRIVKVCQENKIMLVPLVNLLGHQSWASEPGALIKNYPQFDETPWVKFPQEYKWPNADSLYCKSYCPLHPDVHRIVFDLVDEITDVCETDHFHAGMDEVFYIGEDKCPRCSGKDKAHLFGGEVTRIRDHLADKGRTIRIPVHVVEKLNQISRAERTLVGQLGREPTAEEIGAVAGTRAAASIGAASALHSPDSGLAASVSAHSMTMAPNRDPSFTAASKSAIAFSVSPRTP